MGERLRIPHASKAVCSLVSVLAELERCILEIARTEFCPRRASRGSGVAWQEWAALPCTLTILSFSLAEYKFERAEHAQIVLFKKEGLQPTGDCRPIRDEEHLISQTPACPTSSPPFLGSLWNIGLCRDSEAVREALLCTDRQLR